MTVRVESAAEPPAGGVVLVVDDDGAVRFVVREALLSAGCEVQDAASGDEALRLLAACAFDAVVSDIAMPGMNGVQLLRRIRERDLDVPVILLTGQPSLETAVEAVEAGALRYMQKPVTIAELASAVGDAVRLGRLARWRRQALEYVAGEQRLHADRSALASALDRALEACRLEAQPIVEAASGAVYAHELLLRSDGGPLRLPSAIFDAAERLGRVTEVGRAVRRLAAQAPVERLFVNVHAQELEDEELYSPQAPLSARAGEVVLEVTERGSLEGVRGLQERITRLRRLGYRIAVDDLGAGYAALNSFAALRPDVAKLDVALVRGVDGDPYRRKLIGSVTAMCRDLGIRCVAEGIETAAERAVLVQLGCDLLQGFLLGRPAPLRVPEPLWASPR